MVTPEGSGSSGEGDRLQSTLLEIPHDSVEELFSKSDGLGSDAASVAVGDAIVDELRARDVAHLSREEVAGEPGSLYVGGTLHRCSWAMVDTPKTLKGTELARAILSPQLGPHAALTWRSAGLFYSKKDGYVLANAYFEEAVDRLTQWGRNDEVQESYRAREQQPSRPDDPNDQASAEGRLAEMHEETFEQVLLGQTGTAARTVEFVLTQWDSQARAAEDETNQRDVRLIFYRLYKVSLRAIRYGEESEERLRGIHTVAKRTVHRIATMSWKRRPRVMTARSHLLSVPLCRVLKRLQARHPRLGDDWGRAIGEHRESFLEHYRGVVAPLVDAEGRSVPANDDHLREIAQLRLAFALVFADGEIEPPVSVDPTVAREVLFCLPHVDIDAHAVWLYTHPGRDGKPSDGNVIASIVCSDYTEALLGLPDSLSYPDFILRYYWLPRAAAVDKLEGIAPGLRRLRETDPRSNPERTPEDPPT